METKKHPLPKHFDSIKFKNTIDNLSIHMHEHAFENACTLIAIDILKVYERFEHVEVGPGLHGRPFDFFGFKDGKPYIIDLQASLDHFNVPGEVQKRRMKRVVNAIDGLNIALLQLRLNKREYRIFYNKEMDVLLKGKRIPIKPIIDWLKQKCEA